MALTAVHDKAAECLIVLLVAIGYSRVDAFGGEVTYQEPTVNRDAGGDLCEKVISEVKELYEDGKDRPPDEGSERELDRCLRKILMDPHGKAWLQEAFAETHSRILTAKVMLLIADREYVVDGNCSRSEMAYREVGQSFPDTSEGVRAQVMLASRCLIAAGRDEEAIDSLRTIGWQGAPSMEQAHALYELGVVERWRGNRGAARVAYQALIDRYPQNLQYPWVGGIRLVEAAQIDLETLDQYNVGPLTDRLIYWIRREFNGQTTPFAPARPWAGPSLVVLVSLVAKCAGLLLAILTARVFKRARPFSASSRVFKRAWSVPRASLVLVLFWMIPALARIVIDVASRIEGPLQRVAFGGVGTVLGQSIMIVVILFLCLRGESKRTVFFKVQGGWTRMCLMILLVSIALGLGVRYTSHSLGGGTNLNSPTYMSSYPFVPFGIAATIIGVCGQVVIEECIFRGILFEAFQINSGLLVSTVCSACLFAVSHLPSLSAAVIFVMFAMLAQYLRARSKSLGPPVVFHLLFNAPIALLAR